MYYFIQSDTLNLLIILMNFLCKLHGLNPSEKDLYHVAVLQLFLLSMRVHTPVIMENITLPCLRILHQLIRPEAPSSKKHKVKTFVI